jgi:methylenetetrahydrofolate dehydrogenase (NADP+) / methenyltetrahydrofolate cyclohydrolase
MNIIDGKRLAEKMKDEIAKEVFSLGENRPNLAIILVGEREDSKLYVSLKEEEAKKVGIDTHLYHCPADIDEREVFDMVDFLNKDESIDAILVQLPLPAGFDTDGIILAIDPLKDVDGFHPDNLKVLFDTCKHQHVVPPVFRVVLEMLDAINFDLAGKKACVVANSDVFGAPLVKVLECRQAEAFLVKANDKDLAKQAATADLLITAIGRPHFITADMVKQNAVVIDIGITKKDGKVLGDVDFVEVEKKASFITPVPGGVGPMTIAATLQNTVELYKRRRQG